MRRVVYIEWCSVASVRLKRTITYRHDGFFGNGRFYIFFIEPQNAAHVYKKACSVQFYFQVPFSDKINDFVPRATHTREFPDVTRCGQYNITGKCNVWLLLRRAPLMITIFYWSKKYNLRY